VTRRLTKNLTPEQQTIIKRQSFVVHIENLPISITLNKSILQKIERFVPSMKKYKCTHLRMLKHDKNKLALTVYKTVA
jgi:hypothetical protein